MPILKQYNNLLAKIKKDFQEICNSNGDLYRVINKSISYLEQKIENLKELKEDFSKQKEKLERNTITLEDEIRLSKFIGEKDILKNNIVKVNKIFIERYNQTEDQNNEIIKYFDSSIRNIKIQLNKGEIKLALNYIKEINEVLKNGY